jgi:hypothetical protein
MDLESIYNVRKRILKQINGLGKQIKGILKDLKGIQK